MKKFHFVLAALTMLAVASCLKIEDTDGDADDVKNVKEVTFPPQFEWSTSDKVALHMAGLTGLPEIKQVLTVESESGEVFLKEFILINQDFDGEVTVPSTIKTLKINCGAYAFTSEIKNSKIDFTLNNGNPDD